MLNDFIVLVILGSQHYARQCYLSAIFCKVEVQNPVGQLQYWNGRGDPVMPYLLRCQDKMRRKTAYHQHGTYYNNIDGTTKDGNVKISLSSPALTAFVDTNKSNCSEFTCSDGGCVPRSLLCDGSSDCADSSDEVNCYLEGSHPKILALHRAKRQTACRKDQWPCRDGSCIPFHGKCDGLIDCADRSDETHALCKNSPCQYNWFRCTYGACVDGTAPCNRVQDCADNSDELLPRCRNETGEISGTFKCQDGSTIPAENHCDGTPDCADKSDETVRACSSKQCHSYLFQCAYGACVDQGSDCNGKKECADGSDETTELCDRIGPVVTSSTTSLAPPKSGSCQLPDYPPHGRYVVVNAPNARPGQALEFAQLNISCNTGYGLAGTTTITCYNGWWAGDMPTCNRFCKLYPDESVRYRCFITAGDNSAQGFRDCGEYEPIGTMVRPECRGPNYHSDFILRNMKCIDGSWDYVATCVPECGKVTPDGTQLVIGGGYVIRGEFPWHAGIYAKTFTPYKLLCGGSIVSDTVVISAAHCFWSDSLERQLPAQDYAVAVGKINRQWNNPDDKGAQKFDVTSIKIPQHFRGREANFQDDIAMVILAFPIKYKTYIRPICVDFDYFFDRQQLIPGKSGKVAGWGLTTEQGNPSQLLKVVDMPFVDIPECVAGSTPDFRQFITSDKICAGYWNGTALCRGDSGGGLAFAGIEKGTQRYYLRGVVSTASRVDDKECNALTPTTFTRIIKHEYFIKEYI